MRDNLGKKLMHRKTRGERKIHCVILSEYEISSLLLMHVNQWVMQNYLTNPFN